MDPLAGRRYLVELLGGVTQLGYLAGLLGLVSNELMGSKGLLGLATQLLSLDTGERLAPGLMFIQWRCNSCVIPDEPFIPRVTKDSIS